MSGPPSEPNAHLAPSIRAGLVHNYALPPTPAFLSALLPTLRPHAPPHSHLQTALFRILSSDLTACVAARPDGANVFPADLLGGSSSGSGGGGGGGGGGGEERGTASPPSPPATRILRTSSSTTSSSSFSAAPPPPPPSGDGGGKTGIPVQVLDVADVGRSRWAQVEALEAAERGEGTRGREVVRLPPMSSTDEDDGGGGSDGDVHPERGGGGGGGGQHRGEHHQQQQQQKAGPHKLLLQDCAGQMAYALELGSVDGVSVGMGMGAKLLLMGDVTVARGVVLLEQGKCEVLGGKVDAWDKEWKAGKKERLKRGIEESNAAAGM